MGEEELTEELLRNLNDGVVNFEADKIKKISKMVLSEGIDAYDAVMNGLMAVMEVVGDLYEQNEYFVPELLIAADALYAGLDILRPHIKIENLEHGVEGQVVI
jgi:methanogenic corrinoid protein MtbC1